MKFVEKGISFALIFSLLIAGSPKVTAHAVVENPSTAFKSEEIAGDYIDGELILTLAAPEDADDALLDEGSEFASGVTVENVMDFGDADCIAETAAEERELADENLYISVVKSEKYSTEELKELLQNEENVLDVMPNYRFHKQDLTNDSLISDQWSLGGSSFAENTSVSGGVQGIKYSPEEISADTDVPIVAVVDDGIDYTHEDLKDNMWVNPYSKSVLSGTYGYDFVNDDADPIPTDDEDTHGTHVAGLVAAETNNETGIAGVAEAKLMALKVFDSDSPDSGDMDVILQAYYYIHVAQTLGANIVAVNCSFGDEPSKTYTDSTSYRNAYNSVIKSIGAAGALTVFSAGNESTNLENYTKHFPMYLDKDYTVMVGASTPDDDAAGFSNYGKTGVDVFAPGATMLSTVSVDTFLPSSYSVEKRSRLCQLYEDFSSSSTDFVTYTDVIGRGSSALEISTNKSVDFFTNKNGGSLAVRIKYVRTVSSAAGIFLMDISGLDINARSTYYLSYDFTSSNYDGKVWFHDTGRLPKTNIYTAMNGKTYLVFSVPSITGSVLNAAGGVTLYFDNIAISTENPDTSEFGKYDYMNGTSMAAPVVSGAIARLASLYPKDNASTRKKKLLTAVRKVDLLTDACSTGGIIDVSRYADDDIAAISQKDPVQKVTKVVLNKTKATLKVGRTLKLKASVSPASATNKSVKWKVSNTKYASVTQKGVVKAKKKGKGHTVTVTATAKDGSKKKATCKIKIK